MTKSSPTFIFDLDGTITSEETLPLIAKHFDVENQIGALTEETIRGNVPFIESFIKRVHLLGQFPVDEINELTSGVQLHPRVNAFIQQHKTHCLIATGNLNVWVEKLAARIGCKMFASDARVIDNRIVRLDTIFDKEALVRQCKSRGETVVFIGDGNNDAEAMREADVAIASGLTHEPARSVLAVADYVIFDEDALCRQLNQLC